MVLDAERQSSRLGIEALLGLAVPEAPEHEDVGPKIGGGGELAQRLEEQIEALPLLDAAEEGPSAWDAKDLLSGSSTFGRTTVRSGRAARSRFQPTR